MANDGAPVCNLPNIGQVPALQPGRLSPSIPKAQDLPSLVQAVNAMSQIVLQLTQPGLAPFRNNVGPINILTPRAGTSGIVGAAGSDGSAARGGKDGKDGKKAKDPKWKQGEQKSEKVKVKGTEENEECFLIMRRVTHLTMTSSADGKKKIEWQGTVGGAYGGPIEMGQPLTGTGSEGRPFKGSEKSDRETTEENPIFPSRGVNGSGMAANPFQPGLMADCVGVSWGGGVGFLFVGSEGVYTSKTGEEWGKVGEGFSANAVAYGKKVWVAATDGGMMLSKDKGKTWKSSGSPKCQQLVFAGPWVEDDHKEDTGAFYALDQRSDDVEGGDVYSSVDGTSWDKILSIPKLEQRDTTGPIGYTSDFMCAQGSTAVLTATQWNQVVDFPFSFDFTVAAKYEGTGGSLGEPSNYGSSDEGLTSFSVGGGAAPGFIAYLKAVNDGVSSVDDDIVVNGGSVLHGHATIVGGAFFGNRLGGGAPLAAADGQAWFFGSELVFTPDTIQYFLMTGDGGGRYNLSEKVPLGSINVSIPGTLAVLPSNKKRETSFCASVSVGTTNKMLANVGGRGWTEVFSHGGAVGAGKIATGKKATG